MAMTPYALGMPLAGYLLARALDGCYVPRSLGLKSPRYLRLN